MHILVISNYYPPLELGGWEQLTRDVCTRLTQRGHQVRVLTSNYRADERVPRESHVERVLHLESPDHVHYHPHYTLWRSWWERQNRHALQRVVDEFEPDVIFVNGMWNLPHSVARHAEELLPQRVVYYVASYWATELDAHTSYWHGSANGSWRQIPKGWLSKLVHKTLLPNARRNQLDFAHVLCVSAFMQNHMICEAGVPRPQTRVVHNGIEPELFRMRNLAQSSEQVRFLYAGRLSQAKGVHTAIEAFVRALNINAHLPMTLSIVGGGTPAYEAQLRKQVAESNATQAVSFYGKVPREQMPAILAEHDVLLLPSIWDEPLARMTQEAMACGLVVIATSTGGTPEIVHDEQNGLLFAANDVEMLAKKITRVAGDGALRRRLAQAARQTVDDHFTMDRMVDEIESYLQMVTTQQAVATQVVATQKETSIA